MTGGTIIMRSHKRGLVRTQRALLVNSIRFWKVMGYVTRAIFPTVWSEVKSYKLALRSSVQKNGYLSS